MALGIFLVRSAYTLHSIYLRGTIHNRYKGFLDEKANLEFNLDALSFTIPRTQYLTKPWIVGGTVTTAQVLGKYLIIAYLDPDRVE